MYVRATTRKNKDGSTVRYLQLAHNEWDAATGTSRPQVLHSFGREDQLDRAAIERLVASLAKLLDPAAALRATSGSELTFLASRPMGGAHALDGLWHRIGIDTVMKKLLTGRRLDPAAERVLFALVANRALAPSSKLAATRWIEHDSHIPGLPATSDDACYRAMDWLLKIEDKLAEEVYWQVADLLNLEVDLLFFDTTSTYFETGEPDTPVARDEHGLRLPDEPADHAGPGLATEDSSGDQKTASFRAYGKSKDHRPDLPRVVIGMAVTRTGIPIRVWSWPGAGPMPLPLWRSCPYRNGKACRRSTNAQVSQLLRAKLGHPAFHDARVTSLTARLIGACTQLFGGLAGTSLLFRGGGRSGARSRRTSRCAARKEIRSGSRGSLALRAA
jgi:hypothetical protein